MSCCRLVARCCVPLALSACIAGIVPAAEPLETVPASEMPPIAGSGWFCFDYAVVAGNRSFQHSRCARTREECDEEASGVRTGRTVEGVTDVGFCQPDSEAACYYVWNNESDGRHRCFRTLRECQGRVDARRDAAGSPGARQSECIILK